MATPDDRKGPTIDNGLEERPESEAAQHATPAPDADSPQLPGNGSTPAAPAPETRAPEPDPSPELTPELAPALAPAPPESLAPPEAPDIAAAETARLPSAASPDIAVAVTERLPAASPDIASAETARLPATDAPPAGEPDAGPLLPPPGAAPAPAAMDGADGADGARPEPAQAREAPLLPLLPLAPGVEGDDTFTDLLPAIDSSFVMPFSTAARLPAMRLTTLGKRRGAIPRWAPYATGLSVTLVIAALIAAICPVLGVLPARIRGSYQLPALTQRLDGDTAVTRLDARNAGFGGQTYAVAQAFTAYYASHNGQTALGPAITPAFNSNLGETQFFTCGALVSLGGQTVDALVSGANDGPGDIAPELASEGVEDAGAGVVALSLNGDLLALGSAAPLGGPDSGATYATLRDAAQPAAFVAAPKPASGDQVIHLRSGPDVTVTSRSAFVFEGMRGGQKVGHTIPLTLWSAINQDALAPQGWLADLGMPLTEALPVTVTRDGAPHHLLVQAFTQATLIADLDAPDSNGAPTISFQSAGLDYLLTAGGPTVYASGNTPRWLSQDGALRTAAGSATVAVGLNANTQVTLSGAARWFGGALWYSVAWRAPARSGVAWVSGNALTASKPTAPPVDGFDALSPSLAGYLGAQGQNVGVVVYDITRGTMYSYNGGGAFVMASSAKVPLLISYLEYIESQGRGPNGYEQYLMRIMIENSDNNAAQVIYDTVGYDPGQRAHMAGWGITDYAGNPNGWGWATWSPGDMAQLLTLLQQGKVLNAPDRAFALSLMNNIESDQQFGVGDSAPHGASFWMKDGWVNGPDGAWAVNSSGIVTIGKETYVVTVYGGELDSFSQGVDIANHVCGAVGQALK